MWSAAIKIALQKIDKSIRDVTAKVVHVHDNKLINYEYHNYFDVLLLWILQPLFWHNFIKNCKTLVYQ